MPAHRRCAISAVPACTMRRNVPCGTSTVEARDKDAFFAFEEYFLFMHGLFPALLGIISVEFVVDYRRMPSMMHRFMDVRWRKSCFAT
eukprot:3000242-Pleurochrysis_carterae.AAC.1